MKVEFSPASEADFEDIGDHIALQNPMRAVSFVRELRIKATRIGEFPNAGPPRFQWGDGVRIAIHGPYLLVYRVRNERVQILRVVHGARDLDALFEAEPSPSIRFFRRISLTVRLGV